METKTTNENQQFQNKGVFIEPRINLSKDKQNILIFIPGTNMIIRKNINYFKAIMGVPYEKLAK